ncbi:hypothetical protein GCM10027290_20090 [Micromonospora sonneratiae]|uniref:DUF4245 domain-containing protein n=1 Tax=Micromonospora sonneratiae TaxID=1184706 RepID=A0ABW3YGH5_9ACTN
MAKLTLVRGTGGPDRGNEPSCEDGYVDLAQPAGRTQDDQTVDASAVDSRRSQRSAKDMAISMLVLLVPIALLLGFYRVFLGGDQPVVVDPAPAIAQARSANAFPVVEPTGLGSEWRTVSASFRRADDGATLRIGYLSPDGRGVQLVQSNVPAERLIPTELAASGQAQGAVELAGRSWQRYPARSGERALVLLEPTRTVIVVGAAPESELHDLARSLA